MPQADSWEDLREWRMNERRNEFRKSFWLLMEKKGKKKHVDKKWKRMTEYDRKDDKE